MPLEHAFSRLGFQDNPNYGRRRDTRGLIARIKRYRTGTKAYSVIRSFLYWLDVMSRKDMQSWNKRAKQVKAMIIDSHTFPDNYINNDDKSGMINLINYELYKEKTRLIGIKRKRR